MPLPLIIIPVFNAFEHLEACLESVRRTVPADTRILLIDDACGSGATLNIAAKKIKQKFPQTKIYALTFVGSMNGFDVIAQI